MNTTYRVLVVDDEQVSRDYIRALPLWLDSRFILAREVSSARDALRVLENGGIDIVLLDVFMPGMDGVSLSGEIARRFPHVDMLAVSSYDDYDYVREIMKNGAEDYLLKHRLDNAVLTRVLEAAASRHTPGRERPKGKTDLQASLRQWLLEDAASPFPPGTRLSVSLLRTEPIGHLPPAICEAVAQGILELAAGCRQEREAVAAIFLSENRYVLCIQLPPSGSEGELLARRERCCAAIREKIWSVYNLHSWEDACPLFVNHNLYPSYIRHRLEADANPPQAKGLTLTIAQRKALLSALEQRDTALIESQIRAILIPGARQEDLLLVVKELLEIAAGTLREHGGDLDFLTKRKDLYHWIRSKDTKQLADRMAGLYRQLVAQMGAEEETYTKTIGAAVAYLERNATRQIGLQEAAEHLGVNPSYLSRRFHQETGRTVVEYLNWVRIERAKEDIRQGYPLKAVAARSGFASYAYFSRVFKEYEGVRPADYDAQNAPSCK